MTITIEVLRVNYFNNCYVFNIIKSVFFPSLQYWSEAQFKKDKCSTTSFNEIHIFAK